jgi:O-Antigen ligase/Tetratricopeptide repeat
VLEVQRDLVYLTGAVAFVGTARRGLAWVLVGGVLAAIVAVASYALATRLFPDVLGYESGGPYQLLRPIGYWNALGILAVFGLLLALGVASEAPRRARALVAAAVPVLVATTYFTFSRGALVALAVGLAVLFALHPHRGRLGAAAVVVAPFALAAVLLGSRADALTHAGASLDDATHDGHRLAAVVAALTVLSALASPLVDTVHGRVRLGARARRASALALAAAVLVGAVVVVARAGGPGELIGRSYDSFRGPFTQTGDSLGSRLFATSGNSRADYWSVAGRTAAEHPLVGSGAGTFDIQWYRERPGQLSVRDAHNLYLETLAELGIPGLLLLGAALLVPVAAVLRRRDWASASAAGAYSAFLAHAALDWDWEIPTVTLTALACAAAMLATARPMDAWRSLTRPVRIAALAAAVLVATMAAVQYVGAEALLTSQNAFDAGRFEEARRQAERATTAAPWSSEALVARGEAELALGRVDAARESLRQAVEKDPNDWWAWYRLGLATSGAERANAAREVARLNPLGIEAQLVGR